MIFDWDDANIGHIAAHHISPEEADEALCDPYRLPAPVYRVAAERRRGALGSTEDGRLLFVVTVRRGTAWRVVTARDATASERRRYSRRGK